MIITAKNWWIFCCSWKYRLILAIIIKTLNGNCTLLPSICCQIYFSNWPPSPGIRDSLWLLVQLVLKHHVSFYSSFQGWAVCVILVVQAAEEGAKNVIAFWLYSCSPILTTVCSYTEVLGEKILTVFVVFPLVSPCCDAFFFFFWQGNELYYSSKAHWLCSDKRQKAGYSWMLPSTPNGAVPIALSSARHILLQTCIFTYELRCSPPSRNVVGSLGWGL